MSSIVELSFIQKSYELKQNILSQLYTYYKEDSSLHSRNTDKRVFNLAKKGRREFEDRFPKELPKEECISSGVSKPLYSLESRTGRTFFFSVETLDYIKNLFKQPEDSKNTALSDSNTKV